MFPNRVPIDRDTLSPEPLVYSFIHSFIHSFIRAYVPESPKRSSPACGKKYKVTVQRAPCRQKAYIQWGAAWFPKRIVNNTAITTPVTCSLQHHIFYLGSSRPKPCLPVCVISNPHQLIPSTTVTASHVTQGRVEYKSTIPQGMDKGLDLWEAGSLS